MGVISGLLGDLQQDCTEILKQNYEFTKSFVIYSMLNGLLCGAIMHAPEWMIWTSMGSILRNKE